MINTEQNSMSGKFAKIRAHLREGFTLDSLYSVGGGVRESCRVGVGFLSGDGGCVFISSVIFPIMRTRP